MKSVGSNFRFDVANTVRQEPIANLPEHQDHIANRIGLDAGDALTSADALHFQQLLENEQRGLEVHPHIAQAQCAIAAKCGWRWSFDSSGAPMIRWLLIPMVCLAGCGSQAKVRFSKPEEFQPEITRVAETLEPAKAAEFKTAAEVLAFHVAQSATSEDTAALSLQAAFNGKTPDQIVAEYNKLDPAFRRQAGTAISSIRTLKEGNDYMGRALDRYKELETMEDKHPGIYLAIGHVSSLHVDKEILEGRLPAAKWYEAELSKTPEQLINEYGGEHGLNLVEESHKAVKAAGK